MLTLDSMLTQIQARKANPQYQGAVLQAQQQPQKSASLSVLLVRWHTHQATFFYEGFRDFKSLNTLKSSWHTHQATGEVCAAVKRVGGCRIQLLHSDPPGHIPAAHTQ
jgi:hypothetical protein